MPSDKPLQNSTEELGAPSYTSTTLDTDSQDSIDPLSAMSLQALARLARYKAPRDNCEWLGLACAQPADEDTVPPERRAAVLVALFGSRTGANLNVLLTTRSLGLRTFVSYMVY